MTGPARTVPKLWDLIDLAMELDDVRTLHLTIGRPPVVRLADRDLQPLREGLPELTLNSLQAMLGGVVEPERWDALERTGEGEIVLSSGSGRPISLVLFRSSEAWSAVIHF